MQGRISARLLACLHDNLVFFLVIKTPASLLQSHESAKAMFADMLLKPLCSACADLYNTAGILMLAITVYASLYLAIGKPFLPTQGPAWAIVFVWFCALVMGFAVDRVRLYTLSAISTLT